MQTTKKSKIFLSVLFLAALLFVSCSFEDTLGTNGRNTGGNYTEGGETGGGGSSGGTSGGGSSGGNTGGGSGGSEENNGSSIPKTYHGKYTKVGRDPSYITVGIDNRGDYIMIEGGNKEYVKDLVYMGENSWKQVEPYYGYYSTTWQYTLKTENNIRKFYFITIGTFTDTERNFVRSSTNSEIQYWHN